MQDDFPPDIQSPKPLDKRLQILLATTCVLILAIGTFGVWYRQFRPVRISFQIRNYLASPKLIDRFLKYTRVDSLPILLVRYFVNSN